MQTTKNKKEKNLSHTHKLIKALNIFKKKETAYATGVKKRSTPDFEFKENTKTKVVESSNALKLTNTRNKNKKIYLEI